MREHDVRPSDDSDVQARVAARVDQLNRDRGWPWEQPGAVSVSLDGDGRIVEGVADDNGNIVVTRVLGRVDSADG